MAYAEQYTIMICTVALRQDTNNMFRGLSDLAGRSYDTSPINSLPGTCSIGLAATLNSTSPWLTTPTHYMGGTWETLSYQQLMTDLKAGAIPTRDWLPFNLTQSRAKAAGQALYTRSQAADEREPSVIVAENLAAALAELGLQRIPNAPLPTG